jgi:Protein of unknown function (DUF3226)
MIPTKPPSPPPTPVPISLSKLLLVEGSTPMHFFEALLREIGIANEVEIRDFRGNSQLKTAVDLLASTAEFKALVNSVGIIRDAEDDHDGAFASARHALDAAGLDDSNPDVLTAIYILPDDQNPGMIETLCVDAIRNDPVFDCVEEFFRCAEQQGVALPSGIVRAKNISQAYLATRDEVQLFPGIAAYRRYWPWDSAVFDDIKDFLNSL